MTKIHNVDEAIVRLEALSEKLNTDQRYGDDEDSDFIKFDRKIDIFKKYADLLSLAQIKRVIEAYRLVYAFEGQTQYESRLSYEGFDGAVLWFGRPYDSSFSYSGRSYKELLLNLPTR